MAANADQVLTNRRYPKMRVLLVEDHRPMRESIVGHLQERGFAVDCVCYGHEALAAAATLPLDAVILDLGLPDIDGMHVLSSLRGSHPALPTILLTEGDAVDDRLNGLNAGADDCIAKPFNLLELEARLRAVLRRTGAGDGAHYSLGSRLNLTRREAALLEVFLRVPGRVIIKDVLENRLYATEASGSPNALEATISRLRRKLTAAQAGVRIETQWGIGYRLVI